MIYFEFAFFSCCLDLFQFSFGRHAFSLSASSFPQTWYCYHFDSFASLDPVLLHHCFPPTYTRNCLLSTGGQKVRVRRIINTRIKQILKKTKNTCFVNSFQKLLQAPRTPHRCIRVPRSRPCLRFQKLLQARHILRQCREVPRRHRCLQPFLQRGQEQAS